MFDSLQQHHNWMNKQYMEFYRPAGNIQAPRPKHLGLNRTPQDIALMRAVKLAIDPKNILSPGKIR